MDINRKLEELRLQRDQVLEIIAALERRSDGQRKQTDSDCAIKLSFAEVVRQRAAAERLLSSLADVSLRTDHGGLLCRASPRHRHHLTFG